MSSEVRSRSCSARDIPLLHVVRHGDHHSVHDLEIDVELELDVDAAAVDGTAIVRAVQALSEEHAAGEPEAYAHAIARYCATRIEGVASAQADVRLRSWDRLDVGGRPRPRDLVRPAVELRVARVELSGGRERTAAGLRGLQLLMPTGAGGAAAVLRLDALWTYGWSDVPFGTQWQQIRRVLTEAWAERPSSHAGALVVELARNVLEQAPPVSDVDVTLETTLRPPVDMNAFGLENTGAVFGGGAAARTVHVARLRRSEIL